MILSVVAVIVIVLIITADFAVTTLVSINVFWVDLFLMAVIHFWDLTLNPLVMLNVIVSVGIAVDYSAHIAYAYLTQTFDENNKDTNTPEKIRKYKATMSLRLMGSSVFHGGFSTFLAICVLSFGKSYIFKVFFRCWFGIIFFGIANGFLILPVLLSFFGPINSIEDPLEEQKKDEVKDSDSNKNSEPTSAATKENDG